MSGDFDLPETPPGPCAHCGTEMVWKADGDRAVFVCLNPDHEASVRRRAAARPEITQGWDAERRVYEFPIFLEPHAASLEDAERQGARMVRAGQAEVRIFDPNGRHVSTLRRSGDNVVAYHVAVQ